MKGFYFLVLLFVFLTGSGFSAGDYKIGVGDVLGISVWKEEDLTLESIRVRLDGKITLPLVNDVSAAGLTTMELRNLLKKRLGEYVEAPEITISLLSSESQKFYILGEIRNTGEYRLVKDLTIMQAFALAGGFTEWAVKKKIMLFRMENGKKIKKVINYKDILKGDLTKDIFVKKDDIIVVP